MEPLDALSLIDMALSLCKSLHRMFETMKTNRQLCQDLAKKVQALQDLVGTINRSGRIPSHVCRALKALCEHLDSADGLMAKFKNISPVVGFLKSGNIKEKFSCIDKKLNDSLQILSTALQVQHGRVLDRVYYTVGNQSSHSRPPLPDLQTFRSPSVAVPAACCGVPMSPTVAAIPSMAPTSAVMVPLVFTGAPATSSFSATSTTYISRGVSPKALKVALESIPQIYAAGQPAVIGRCSLLPSKSKLKRTSIFH